MGLNPGRKKEERCLLYLSPLPGKGKISQKHPKRLFLYARTVSLHHSQCGDCKSKYVAFPALIVEGRKKKGIENRFGVNLLTLSATPIIYQFIQIFFNKEAKQIYKMQLSEP